MGHLALKDYRPNSQGDVSYWADGKRRSAEIGTVSLCPFRCPGSGRQLLQFIRCDDGLDILLSLSFTDLRQIDH